MTFVDPFPCLPLPGLAWACPVSAFPTSKVTVTIPEARPGFIGPHLLLSNFVAYKNVEHTEIAFAALLRLWIQIVKGKWALSMESDRQGLQMILPFCLGPTGLKVNGQLLQLPLSSEEAKLCRRVVMVRRSSHSSKIDGNGG